jgi:ferritin
MKIDNTVLKLIQRQISVENSNNLIYIELANWCSFNGYDGAAKLFTIQAEGEMNHRDRFISYLLDLGYMPEAFTLNKFDIGSIESLEDTVYASLALEQNTTKLIVAIKEAANEADDYVSSKLINWFLSEQREEESLFIGLIGKINQMKLSDSATPDWFKGSLRIELDEYMLDAYKKIADTDDDDDDDGDNDSKDTDD